ncbi:MAG: YbhB/YbcL family Raf kinase inhibitor-like protein [Myxococcales bacterium]
MLQFFPRTAGRALTLARSGPNGLAMHRVAAAGTPEFAVTSPAFIANMAIPSFYTADGRGLSPPVRWRGAPLEARSIMLVIEDVDSPSLLPLVHGMAWVAGRPQGEIIEGALNAGSDGALTTLGRNSFLRAGYLPMDPPPGHGPHHYMFQVFALKNVLQLQGIPGRNAVLDAMRGQVLAHGRLLGIYERR